MYHIFCQDIIYNLGWVLTVKNLGASRITKYEITLFKHNWFSINVKKRRQIAVKCPISTNDAPIETEFSCASFGLPCKHAGAFSINCACHLYLVRLFCYSNLQFQLWTISWVTREFRRRSSCSKDRLQLCYVTGVWPAAVLFQWGLIGRLVIGLVIGCSSNSFSS